MRQPRPYAKKALVHLLATDTIYKTREVLHVVYTDDRTVEVWSKHPRLGNSVVATFHWSELGEIWRLGEHRSFDDLELLAILQPAGRARQNTAGLRDDQLLLMLDKMHRAGGMRADQPTPENLARRLGVPVSKVHEALLRLRKEKKVRWRSRFAPRPGQPIDLRLNPAGRYGAPPPVGHALGQLAREGFTAARFVKEATGRRGPVLVFRARKGKEEVVVNVGRVSGETLQILWKPLSMRGRVNPDPVRASLDEQLAAWGWTGARVTPVKTTWNSFRVIVEKDTLDHGPYEVVLSQQADGQWQSGRVRWLTELEALAIAKPEA